MSVLKTKHEVKRKGSFGVKKRKMPVKRTLVLITGTHNQNYGRMGEQEHSGCIVEFRT